MADSEISTHESSRPVVNTTYSDDAMQNMVPRSSHQADTTKDMIPLEEGIAMRPQSAGKGHKKSRWDWSGSGSNGNRSRSWSWLPKFSQQYNAVDGTGAEEEEEGNGLLATSHQNISSRPRKTYSRGRRAFCNYFVFGGISGLTIL